ncbi:MAG: hypothetical protein AAGI24_11940 [Pseudomonadota bacterium]
MDWKRRTFIKTAISGGTGLGLLGLAGCSDSDYPPPLPESPPDPEPEPVAPGSVRLHFDLPVFDETLGRMVFQHHGFSAELQEHDEQSLDDPAIEGAPRFYADIPTPRNVGLGWLLHYPEGAEDGEHQWLHLKLLIPPSETVAAQARAPAGVARASDRVDANNTVVAPIDSNSSPQDIALAIVFMHPEIMSIDRDEAEAVRNHLLSTTQLTALATQIQSLGRATEQGGWATLKPVERNDDSGETYFKKANGDRIYSLEPAPSLDPAIKQAVTAALALIKADASLPNKQYQAGSVTNPVSSAVRAANSNSAIAARLREGTVQNGVEWSSISLEDLESRRVRIAVHNRSMRYFGMYVEFLNAKDEVISISDLDRWKVLLRSTEDSTVDRMEDFGLGTDQHKFANTSNATPAILGVPVNIESLQDVVTVRMPEDATTLRVMLGSAGLGGHWSDDIVPVSGMLTTVFINILVPAVLMSINAAAENTKALDDMMKSPGFFLALVELCRVTYNAGNLAGPDPDVNDANGQALLRQIVGDALIMAPIVVRAVLEQLPSLAAYFGAIEARSEAEDSVPIVGIVFRVLNATADALTIAQTTSQIVSNPPVSFNDISITQSVTVSINHDLDDFQFPATATHYQVQLIIDGGNPISSPRISLGSTTVSDSISYRFDAVPSGGKIQALVLFYADGAGGIVGRGLAASYTATQEAIDALADGLDDPSQPIPYPAMPTELRTQLASHFEVDSDGVGISLPDTPSLLAEIEAAIGEDAASTYRKYIAHRFAVTSFSNQLSGDGLTLECTIQEQLVTLTSSTQYQHKQKLVLSDATGNGRREWEAGPAPQAALGNLSSGLSDGEVSALGGSALLQRNGQFAYLWRSAASDLVSCSTDFGSEQLWSLQTVSLTSNPSLGFHRAGDSGLPCAQVAPPAVAFDLLGSTSGRGNHFMVSSETDSNGDTHYYARRVSAAPDAVPDFFNDDIVGEFPLPCTSLAVHPAGYLLGVNSIRDKLMVLPLPRDESARIARDIAPMATVYGGSGSLPGLLGSPSAVRASVRGQIYVLESQNRRIQVFDVHGQPSRNVLSGNAFQISLEPTGKDVTLLDIGVDAEDFVFLLGYRNNGLAASDYVLDIYDASGSFLSRTEGLNAGSMTVDLWRNIYSLNFEKLLLDDGRAEPSISLWIPFTPG